MFCTKCGAPMPDNAKFCAKCGAPSPDAETPLIRPPQSPPPKKSHTVTVLAIVVAALLVAVLIVALSIAPSLRGDKSSSHPAAADAAPEAGTAPPSALILAPVASVPPAVTDVNTLLGAYGAEDGSGYVEAVRSGTDSLRLAYYQGEDTVFNGTILLPDSTDVTFYSGNTQWYITFYPDQDRLALSSDHDAVVRYFSASIAASDGAYLYPSDAQRITAAELDGLDRHTIYLIRNEIFARRGYVFQSGELQDYFGQKVWYAPDPNFTTDQFSPIEQDNIDTITAYESEKGWR